MTMEERLALFEADWHMPDARRLIAESGTQARSTSVLALFEIASQLLALLRSAPVHHNYQCPAVGSAPGRWTCTCGAGDFAIRRHRLLDDPEEDR